MQKHDLNKLRKEATQNDRTVQKGLMNIYSNKDGSLPDISHLDVRRRNKWKVYFISFLSLAVVVFGILFLGSSLFKDKYSLGGRSISLNFESQKSIASGDEVLYVLEYKNTDKVSLNNLDIIIRYPEGFSFISSEPASDNEFNTLWKLGTLEKGDKGKIEIKGKLIGEVGTVKTINATASFNPQNFSSTFKETAGFNSEITSSIVELQVEGPSQTLPEKQVSYKIRYKNNSDSTLENMKLQVIYPKNFIFKESNPESYFNEENARNLNNEWLIDQLGEGQEGEIEIIGGYITDETVDSPEFKVQIGFIDPETDEFSLQQEKIINTEVVDSSLKLDLIINGSTQGQPINFDQTLTYSLVYKNSGNKDLDDVVISLTLDSDVLDWDSLEDVNDGKIDGNTITWTKEEIANLDVLRPLDDGSIDLSINVKASDKIDLDNVNLSVHSSANAIITKIGDLDIENLEVKSQEIDNNINTDVGFIVEGRYFNDDNIAVGTGPLPPVVGQTTTFRIFWKLSNSLHEIKNVKVTTALPNGIEWDDKYLVGAGNIAYSESDKTVTWTINRLPANTTFEEADVWFDISVTPTSQQAGKLLILTEQSIFEGTDTVNDSRVAKVGSAVTSNLEDDPIGEGRGLVIDIK